MKDPLVLWRTRRSSGFPWPFSYTPGHRVREAVTGQAWYSAQPLWRQLLGIPARPFRYARKVRTIASVRNRPYGPGLEDSVP